ERKRTAAVDELPVVEVEVDEPVQPQEPPREHSERMRRGELEQRRTGREAEAPRAWKLEPRRALGEVRLPERRRRAIDVAGRGQQALEGVPDCVVERSLNVTRDDRVALETLHRGHPLSVYGGALGRRPPRRRPPLPPRSRRVPAVAPPDRTGERARRPRRARR